MTLKTRFHMSTAAPIHDRDALTRWVQEQASDLQVMEVLRSSAVPSRAKCVVLESAASTVLATLAERDSSFVLVTANEDHLAATARNPALHQTLVDRIYNAAVRGHHLATLDSLRGAGHSPSKGYLDELAMREVDGDTRVFVLEHCVFDFTPDQVADFVHLNGPVQIERLLSTPHIPPSVAVKACQSNRDRQSHLRYAARNPTLANDPVITQLIVASLDRYTYLEYLPLATPEARGQMYRMLLHSEGEDQALRLLESAPEGAIFDLRAEDIVPLQEHESAEVRERAILALAAVNIEPSPVKAPRGRAAR